MPSEGVAEAISAIDAGVGEEPMPRRPSPRWFLALDRRGGLVALTDGGAVNFHALSPERARRLWAVMRYLSLVHAGAACATVLEFPHYRASEGWYRFEYQSTSRAPEAAPVATSEGRDPSDPLEVQATGPSINDAGKMDRIARGLAWRRLGMAIVAGGAISGAAARREALARLVDAHFPPRDRIDAALLAAAIDAFAPLATEADLPLLRRLSRRPSPPGDWTFDLPLVGAYFSQSAREAELAAPLPSVEGRIWSLESLGGLDEVGRFNALVYAAGPVAPVEVRREARRLLERDHLARWSNYLADFYAPGDKAPTGLPSRLDGTGRLALRMAGDASSRRQMEAMVAAFLATGIPST